MRHFSPGMDCAIAGAAIVAAPAAPSPVTLIKSRRFMIPPIGFETIVSSPPDLEEREWTAPFLIPIPASPQNKKKCPASLQGPGPRLATYDVAFAASPTSFGGQLNEPSTS